MNTSLKSYSVASLLAFSVVAAGSITGGCASTQKHDSTGEYVDDTGITTRVKSALLGDGAVKSFEISVQTMKGVVQLSGFVDTPDQKFAAGKDAGAVPGVLDVRNDLVVKQP